MANTVLDDEDELELEDEQRRKQAAQGTIGSMPQTDAQRASALGAASHPMGSPTVPSSTVPPAMPPPEVGAASPPKQPTISEAAPYTPPAPRPESKAFTDWQASDLAQHPANQPRYHGLARAADTIAQMTWPGQAAEVGGEFGTMGERAKANRLAHNAALENTQIGYGEKEREANAKQEEDIAKAKTEETGSELVTIDTPSGPVQVMRKNVATPAAAIINSAERGEAAKTAAGARTDVADINAGAREETARIMVNGKPMATKNIQGPDGKSHVMMWNSATHTYDKDLGLAPPPASASSAYAATRTVQLIDPESGLPTVYQYDPATGTYSKQVGVSSTGAYGHEMAQAGAVERAGTQLIAEIDANRDRIGDVQSVWNAAFMGTPLSDPYQSGLAAKIASFAALNPALHGARGVAAMKEFEQIYGSPINNPDSLIAAIKAGIGTASNIKGKGSPSKPNATGGPVSAGPQKFEDFAKTYKPGGAQ